VYGREQLVQCSGGRWPPDRGQLPGSVRAITDSAGTSVERHDYRPFGEDTTPLPAPGADRTRFLGQERDETQLDQFGARYYSMFIGRFTSVDPIISASAVAQSQKWNRYAYARNNPLRFVDRSGLDDDEDRQSPVTYEDDSSPIWQEFSSWSSGLSDQWRWEYLQELRIGSRPRDGVRPRLIRDIGLNRFAVGRTPVALCRPAL
jgi:RHS repeat-associated protein